MGFSVSKPDFEHPDRIASSTPGHNNGQSIWLTRLTEAAAKAAAGSLTARKTESAGHRHVIQKNFCDT
jgi:hypothetical protein